ncbi:hypothetical protein HOLleu_10644 [Holothuria leucospilota]|uniref:Uncharacterized protein n=1 Tax=Holothuria leucospilota TaxID=206669 RepID=A0A9Q1CEL3_HOLLE|nr:hypothetical protein HOLleu_10644 [Holothuria leucospilota]
MGGSLGVGWGQGGPLPLPHPIFEKSPSDFDFSHSKILENGVMSPPILRTNHCRCIKVPWCSRSRVFVQKHFEGNFSTCSRDSMTLNQETSLGLHCGFRDFSNQEERSRLVDGEGEVGEALTGVTIPLALHHSGATALSHSSNDLKIAINIFSLVQVTLINVTASSQKI